MLEIPLSFTDSNSILAISYQISSSKIELVILQKRVNNTEVSEISVKKYTDQNSFSAWNQAFFFIDSDVDLILLVARKIGVTINVEHVFVDNLKIVKTYQPGI